MVTTLPYLAHIRPEIQREVDSYLALRADLGRMARELRAVFQARMSEQGMSPAEYAVVLEALERRE